MSVVSIRVAESYADLYALHDLAGVVFGRPDAPRVSIANRARRLACPRRNQAAGWVLEEDGRIVSGLLCYPLAFETAAGERRPGFGLGAVATLSEARGRGHASSLCAHVAEREGECGRSLGLLFSAVAPAFYERLGYREIRAFDHVTKRLDELASSGPRAVWNPIDPRRSLAHLASLHDVAHAGRLHLARDERSWRRSLEAGSSDRWLALGDPDGAFEGYARFGVDGVVFDLVELVLSDPALEARALRGLAALALELECTKLGSWLAPSEFVAGWFEDTGRSSTLPMLFDGSGARPTLEGAVFHSSEHF